MSFYDALYYIYNLEEEAALFDIYCNKTSHRNGTVWWKSVYYKTGKPGNRCYHALLSGNGRKL